MPEVLYPSAFPDWNVHVQLHYILSHFIHQYLAVPLIFFLLVAIPVLLPNIVLVFQN
jgi:hypothetical protein